MTSQHLTKMWSEVNGRYFAGLLLPIDLVWSRRLTSSVGMFVSRRGPRPRLDQDGLRPPTRREIRLSLPLLQQAAQRSAYGEQEVVNTLAHEMIHQWQYDILKRRPNHGADFLRKMTEMNQNGTLAITIYHSLQKEVGDIGWVGCSSESHLHFTVARTTNTAGHRFAPFQVPNNTTQINNGVPFQIDPYGFNPPKNVDPWGWRAFPDGALSINLWKNGQAPDLGNWGR